MVVDFDLQALCGSLKKLSVKPFPSVECAAEKRKQGSADVRSRWSEAGGWVHGPRIAVESHRGLATLAASAGYAGRNLETESAVPWALQRCGAEGTLGHRRRFSSEQEVGSGREAVRGPLRACALGWSAGSPMSPILARGGLDWASCGLNRAVLDSGSQAKQVAVRVRFEQ